MIEEAKRKTIDAAMTEIEKTWGKGSIMRIGSGPRVQIEAISTGILSIDAAIGVGGFPRGRIVEVYGPESSGKTTLALHVIAEAQKTGGAAAFVDVEHALDINYASKLGVDVNSLILSQPDYGEQALEIVETLVRTNAFDIIVLDSVAAIVPKSEIEGDMGDAQMALQARLMSQALRKLTAVVNKSKTCLVFINQLRSKIGVMFGNPETTSGGNALKFYASLRIDIRRIGAIKAGDAVIGNKTKVKIIKNKLSPPFREAEVQIMYGMGISKVHDMLDWGESLGVVKKSGAWYTYGEDRFQGRENFAQILTSDPIFFEKLKDEVRSKMDPNIMKVAVVEDTN